MLREPGQRRIEARHACAPVVGAPGALAGLDQPGGRASVVRLLKVVGHCIRVRIAGFRQRLGDPAVQVAPTKRHQILVERLAQQRVAEAVAVAAPAFRQQLRCPPRSMAVTRRSSVAPLTRCHSSTGTSCPMIAATCSSERVSPGGAPAAAR